MANKKIWELTELTDAISADILAIGDDIAGTPLLKFITLLNLFATLKVPILITSSSGSAIIVGPNGATNPVLKVNDSIASQDTGIELIGRDVGAGVSIEVISSGADEDLLLTPKGAGEVVISSGLNVGEGSSVAGSIELGQGTAPAVGTTSVKIHSPAAVTSYNLVLPGASVTGFLLGTDVANVNTITFIAFTGTGDVVRATNPTIDGIVLTGVLDAGGAASLKVPTSAGAAPAAIGHVAFNSTSGMLRYHDGSAARNIADLDTAQTLTSKTLNAPALNNNFANGQRMQFTGVTELTTIAAAATTDTAIQIPANAVVFYVSVRVTTVIPTANNFTVTGTTSSTVFNTAAVSSAANSTDPGNENCPFKNGAAQTIRITPDLTPAANTGRVRVTIFYYTVTPPTS